jgi:carboxypeptidase family protein
MRILIATIVVALTSVVPSSSWADENVVLSGRVTDATTSSVVAGATVFISGSSGLARTLTTDATGRYTTVLEPGPYNVIFVHGSSRTSSKIVVKESEPAWLDGRVDVTSGEVIVIEERLNPPVAPKPKDFHAAKAPPYSDKAILTNAWTKAWLLLDVNERGVVERMKFLKRPGYDLEQIARSQASQLHFEPAKDRFGHPVRSYVVWPIEWPAAWWLVAFNGTRSGMPHYTMVWGEKVRVDDIRNTKAYVPCEGTGPWNWNAPDGLYLYKDCSRPDLTQALREEWMPSTVRR